MNVKVKNFINNFTYTLSSNLITMIVSALVVFIVPKLISVEEYGYWQLFLFYSSYVPFLQFGWTDGIYLRYGGEVPENLNKPLFFSQFIMLMILQCIIATGIIAYSIVALEGIDRIFIFQMTAIYLILVNTRYLFTYVLQATNRFKKFSKIIILDRIFYVILIGIFLFIGVKNYKILIVADIIGKFVSLLYSIYICKDFALLKISQFYFAFSEVVNNIVAGIRLMFSNTASMLIIGAIRLGIERTWDVATFGKVSLTLSISKFMMIFINALGVVMFPVLRRTEQKKLSLIYKFMRSFFTVSILGILLLLYPLKAILSAWLPEYADSLVYMALVFPISVYEGKMALLINPYFKTLRKEGLMLRINLISLVISIIVSFFITTVLKNLDLAILSIVLILAFRCILSEILLSKAIMLSFGRDIVIESIVIIMFIISGWFFNSWASANGYFLTYLIYLCIKRKEVIDSFTKIKRMLKGNPL